MVLVVKHQPANAGDVRDTGSIPGSGRSPEGGHGSTPVFLSGDSHREDCWATVHGVAQSRTRLK